MRFVLLLALLVTVSGCVAVQRIRDATNVHYHRDLEREKLKAENQRQELEERRARNALLKPGVTVAEFVAGWGEPEHVDFENGTQAAYYGSLSTPIYVFFRDDKIVGWKNDLTGKAQREEKELARSQWQEQQEQARRDRVAAALRGFNQQQARPQAYQIPVKQNTRCVSQNNGLGQVVTDCD